MFGQDDSWAEKDTSLDRRLDKIEKKLGAIAEKLDMEDIPHPVSHFGRISPQELLAIFKAGDNSPYDGDAIFPYEDKHVIIRSDGRPGGIITY
jgi:hypothetical protein